MTRPASGPAGTTRRTLAVITVALAVCTMSASAPSGALAQSPVPLPRLARAGDAVQLLVDGKPFLILGGELHNSSASSLEYMAPLWPRLQAMHLNTVLASVSWGELERTEGAFDFTVVDGLLREARRHDLRLVLLWFGSWKNGVSHYAPAWVKRDTRRFPRSRIAAGAPEVLSPFSEANRDADARAFATLMRHLREVDAQRTVLMVQVENEVGLLGDSRDRAAAAESAFARPVPRELIAHLRRNRERLSPELATLLDSIRRDSGTWTELFGRGRRAEELFMAWSYSRYVEHVVAAGKAAYPLPMYVNAWIVQPKDTMPGNYPSGGPQAHVHEVWRAGAPSVDLLAPDIYLPDFRGLTALYQRSGTPLFVPESFAGARGAANAFYAFGQRRAIGYSPFGIEDAGADSATDPLALAYAVLRELTPMIAEHQSKGTVAALTIDATHVEDTVTLGVYRLVARARSSGGTAPAAAYALAMLVGDDELVVAGSGVQIVFSPASGSDVIGLAEVDEGSFVHGTWRPRRRLNGDEIMVAYDMAAATAARQTGTGLRFEREPHVLRVKLYRYR